jgi:electron transfer flavoprotein alpha subunit
VVRVEPPLDQAPRRGRVLERSVAPGPKLEDARTIVAGGKGLLKKENFRYVEELAAVLGGMPAASRAIVDIGWASPAQQVGLTGRTVAPDLYLALGVSGASQHMAGCSLARTIVAVNLDRDAAIMRHARYGVVADCVEFLPAFIEACRVARAQSGAA